MATLTIQTENGVDVIVSINNVGDLILQSVDNSKQGFYAFTRHNWRRIMAFVEQEYTCRVMENKSIDSGKRGGSKWDR